MTLQARFRSFFNQNTNSFPLAAGLAPLSTPLPTLTTLPDFSVESILTANSSSPETTPYWLNDLDLLRDEGSLFGLSYAESEEKIREIQAYFRHQAAPVEVAIDRHNANLEDTQHLLDQTDMQTSTLQERLNEFNNRPSALDNLMPILIRLILLLVLSIGAFYMIDGIFPNRWVAITVFLAGMVNLSGRTSFFYEEDTRLTGRRLMEEFSLPLVSSVYILVQALQVQSIAQSCVLFCFLLFLFLMPGKLFFITLSDLLRNITVSQTNQKQIAGGQQNIPIWEKQLAEFSEKRNDLRKRQLALVAERNQTEANLTRLNAQRDQLVNVFLSEFELARSLRDRLSKQQRESVLHG